MPVIAVDLGRSKARACLVDDELAVGDTIERSTVGVSDPDELFHSAADVALDLLERHPEATAVGMSVAGDVDRDGNAWYRRPIPGDREHVGRGPLAKVELARLVEERSGRPCAVENDGNAALLAEWLAGAAQGHDDVVCYTIGTHIGSGVVCAGELLRRRTSGPSLGPAVSADPALAGATTLIGDRCSGTGIGLTYGSGGAKPVIAAARRGEERALAVLAEAGFWLGLLLANANNMFSPTAIVLGGGVIAGGHDLLLPAAQEAFAKETTLPTLGEPPQIALARFEDDAGVIGAALAAQRLLSQR